MKYIFACALIGLIVTGVAFAFLRQREQRQEFDQALIDQEVAEDVEHNLSTYLSRLQEGDPIVARYGRFIKLEGTGYRRENGFKVGGYLTLDRTAVFDKAKVNCPITVVNRGPLEFKPRMTPTAKFIDDNPQAKLVKSNGTLVMRAPGMEVPTSLDVSVSHPAFFTDATDRQLHHQLVRGVEHAVSLLESGVSQNAPELQTRIQQWYHSQQTTEQINLFLSTAFRHPDPAVRLRAASFLSQSSSGYGKISHPESTVKLLLGVIEDKDQDEALRLELVSAIMLNYEDRRRMLYEKLRLMGEDGYFAIPALAASLTNKSARHFTPGGEFDAPVGAAELLGDWGPMAVNAVPALAEVLDTHPNRQTFAPAAATALGQIGPQAKDAIPYLIRAQTSSRANLREAATTALLKVHTGGELPMNYAVTTESPDVRVGYSFMTEPNHFLWLAEDGTRILSVVRESSLSALCEVDLEERVFRRIADIPTDGLVDVCATSEFVYVLRLLTDEQGCEIVVDKWSLKSYSLTETFHLLAIQTLPPNHQVSLRNVVWNKSATKVAFVQITSKPVQDKPNVRAESRNLHVFEIESASNLVNGQVAEYLMDPISFANGGEALYFYGYNFYEKDSVLAEMHLDTLEFSPVNNSALGGYGVIAVIGDHCIYQASGGNNQPIKLLDRKTGTLVSLQTSDDTARFNRPWDVAIRLLNEESLACIVTETSVDVFQTSTGKLVQRIEICDPRDSTRIQPILFDGDSEEMILLASDTNGAPSSKLWLRRLNILNPASP